MEIDVYYENFEIIYEDRKWVWRIMRGFDLCFFYRGILLWGFYEFYCYRIVILVFGIFVILIVGVIGYYSVGF